MPFTAGASGMSYSRFLPYDMLGAGLWSATWCLLGYIFWQSFEQVASTAGRGTIAFAVLLGLFIGGYQAIKRLRHPEQRAGLRALARAAGAAARCCARWRWVGRAAWTAVLRPVWRYVLRPLWLLIAPPLRFLVGAPHPGRARHRADHAPDDRGVGIYVVVLQIDLLQTDALLPGDDTALDIARDIESGLLTTIANVLRVIGSLWFVGACHGRDVRRSCWSRRRVRRGDRAGGGSRDHARSRCRSSSARSSARGPRTRIYDADGFAYPSGHAALSVTFLAIGGRPVRAGCRTRDRAGDRRRGAGGRDRPLARVPARALPERRGRRLGARPGRLLALRSRRPDRGLSASELERLARGGLRTRTAPPHHGQPHSSPTSSSAPRD